MSGYGQPMQVSSLRFENGLIPVIVQHAETGEVLTLAYMSEESLQRTIESGQTWFWSRSRGELWHKGGTSGNTQQVVRISGDCDRDALVVSVIPKGPACHTGQRSCFDDGPGAPLEELMVTLRQRYRDRPVGSYTASLFNAGRDRILKKIGEEATEVVIAAKGEGRDRMISEITDLVFHLSLLLVDEGIEWSDVQAELRRRAER